MNRKQFIILLVLVAVIGGAGWIIHQRSSQSWQSGDRTIGQKLLPHLDINNIAQVHIQSGTNVVNLAKQNQRWRVTERADYPANFSKLSGLLVKLSNLKVVQTEDVDSSDLGSFHLLPPGSPTNSATVVTFKNDSGKTVDTLLLGKNHMHHPGAGSQYGGMGASGWPDGRYVMVGQSSKVVDVISDPLSGVQPQPAQWLDKEFLSIKNPSSISMQYAVATNSWKLSRPTKSDPWQLADAKKGEKLDNSKLYSVTSPFSSVHFSDVAPLKQVAMTNATVLTVKTFDGFTYVAKIGATQNGSYPVTFAVTGNFPAKRKPGKNEKPAEKAKLDQAFKAKHAKLEAELAQDKKYEKWVYYLPSYSVENLLKTRHQLLVPPKKTKAKTKAKTMAAASTAAKSK